MKHEYTDRNQITISIGVSRWWLSLVHEDTNGEEVKELALVEYIPNSHFQSHQCVPLNVWFDSSMNDWELFIDLKRKPEYYVSYAVSEADVVGRAMNRAVNYIEGIRNKAKGFEIEVEEVQ